MSVECPAGEYGVSAGIEGFTSDAIGRLSQNPTDPALWEVYVERITTIGNGNILTPFVICAKPTG
jgi:hypothetical protein